MRSFRLYACLLAISLPLLVSCSGGGNSSQTQMPPQKSTGSDLQPHTFSLRSNGTAAATVSVRTDSALPSSAFSLQTQSCPSVPAITIVNPFPFPIRLIVDSFTVTLPCTPQQTLFGATFYQVKPQPQVVSPVKLGDASVSGNKLTFTSAVQTFTLAPKSTSQIVILPEASTSDVAFPVAPGSTTQLTSNASNLPSGLNFQYQAASGGTIYSAACFNAYDSSGNLAQALQGVPLVGKPSFYCHMQPANGGITFGNTGGLVQFTIVRSQPDRAIFEPDGDPQGVLCSTDTDATCPLPSFSVPATYQNFIASNAEDLRLCVPADVYQDCNNVDGDAQGGSLTSVSGSFPVLVADDPTYKPGTETAPVPWDGKFRMSLGGPCVLDTSEDNSNGDMPPKYTDQNQDGVGPNAEYDIAATGTGTCTITVSEDPKYITDYSDPKNPQPRSATISVTVTQRVPESRTVSGSSF